jgi:hypothetical protein
VARSGSRRWRVSRLRSYAKPYGDCRIGRARTFASCPIRARTGSGEI